MNRPVFKRIIAAGFLCGTLDAAAASLQYYIRTGNSPARVFRYIASALHGSSALTGGSSTAIEGLLLHYLIALTFTGMFFMIIRLLPGLLRALPFTAILYGCFIWSVMNLIVVPCSRIPLRPFQWDQALIAAGILIICFGIPLTLMAKKNYIYRK